MHSKPFLNFAIPFYRAGFFKEGFWMRTFPLFLSQKEDSLSIGDIRLFFTPFPIFGLTFHPISSQPGCWASQFCGDFWALSSKFPLVPFADWGFGGFNTFPPRWAFNSEFSLLPPPCGAPPLVLESLSFGPLLDHTFWGGTIFALPFFFWGAALQFFGPREFWCGP